jgi:hypothetical protein
LSETGLLGARPADTPMDSTVKLDGEQSELFSDVGRYRRLVGKLIYLTVTRALTLLMRSVWLVNTCMLHVTLTMQLFTVSCII